MKSSAKHIIYILLFFGVLLTALFLSEFFGFGTSKPTAEYEKYQQGNRLERIRKGMTGK